MKKLRTRMMALLLMCILVFAVTPLAYSANLGITRVQQAYSNWCWAACSEMAGRLVRGTGSPNQNAIASWVMGGTPGNFPASDNEVASALAYATNKTVTQSGILAFTAIEMAVNQGRCMIAKIRWNSSGNHVVVIGGYNPTNVTVWLVDPAAGCSNASYSYSALLNGTSIQSGTGSYIRTFSYS